jgi:prepilin-type processing-associated H-X9-DG protein
MNAYLGWKNPDFRSFRYVVTESGPDPDGRHKLFQAGKTVVFSASTTLVLAEEHPRYNMNNRAAGGGFASGYGEGNFNVTDRIATRHGLGLGEHAKGRTNLAYLDGHAETKLYKWTTTADQLFREIGEPTASMNRRAFLTPCRSDECPK